MTDQTVQSAAGTVVDELGRLGHGHLKDKTYNAAPPTKFSGEFKHRQRERWLRPLEIAAQMLSRAACGMA